MILKLLSKTLIIFSVVFISYFSTTKLFEAQAINPPPPPPEDTSCSGFLDCLDNIQPPKLDPKYWGEQGFIGRIISGFLPAILGIAGFLTVIFIVISGIQFILSSGNPEAAAGAKNRLIYALVGFALIVLAFAILQIVNRLFLGPTGVA